MIIDESRKLLLSDTAVPDIFILEYLPGLSGLAVKIYLFLLLTARTSRNLTEQDLTRRLGQEQDEVRAALLELAGAELIVLKERSIEVADVKSAEIERTYRPRTASLPAETDQAQQRFDKREKLMADIARTFFQGLMSPSWYGEIDAWFDRYGFEPEVVYALFQECARRNKLDSKAYIAKVAENWSKRGIVSFNDLNRYFLAHDKISKLSRKVGRKLRKTMTEYDDEIIARWIDVFGYDFEIIDFALRKTTRLNHPNLSFIDRILQEWFEHQLCDLDAVKAYEQEKGARLAKERQGSLNSGGKGANQGNFEQRDYSKEYLDGFYEAVGTDEQALSPTGEREPQQMDLAELMRKSEADGKETRP
ncbi:MAG: DnaD domain protein [Clostridiaceae bacterium]|jgi:DnaD/phage-associated family protein|nr:DnaD domain protein [Clostridiaceae bacterium]